MRCAASKETGRTSVSENPKNPDLVFIGFFGTDSFSTSYNDLPMVKKGKPIDPESRGAVEPVTGNYSENNPYTGEIPNLSFWQQLTDNLGFTNHAENAHFQQEQNAKAWESEYQLALADRDYYSEQSVADRMRAAGQNPDLLGVTAGQVETANNDAANRAAPDMSGAQSFQQFMSTLGSALSTALSLYTGVAGVQNSIFEKDLATVIGLEATNKSNIVDYLAGRVKDSDISKIANDPSSLWDVLFSSGVHSGSPLDLKQILVDQATIPVRNKRVRRYAEQRLMSYFGSSQFQQAVLDSLSARQSSRIKTAEVDAKVNALETLSGDNDDIGTVLKGIAQISYETLEKQTQSDYYGADNSLTYNRNFDAGASAAASNSANRRSVVENQVATDSQAAISQIYKFLADQSRDGNTFASGLLLMLTIGRSVSSSVLPAASYAVFK